MLTRAISTAIQQQFGHCSRQMAHRRRCHGGLYALEVSAGADEPAISLGSGGSAFPRPQRAHGRPLGPILYLRDAAEGGMVVRFGRPRSLRCDRSWLTCRLPDRRRPSSASGGPRHAETHAHVVGPYAPGYSHHPVLLLLL